jgi:hypothetical protein
MNNESIAVKSVVADFKVILQHVCGKHEKIKQPINQNVPLSPRIRTRGLLTRKRNAEQSTATLVVLPASDISEYEI